MGLEGYLLGIQSERDKLTGGLQKNLGDFGAPVYDSRGVALLLTFTPLRK